MSWKNINKMVLTICRDYLESSTIHWALGRPHDESDRDCLCQIPSGWKEQLCSRPLHSICKPTKKTLKSNTRLVFTAENISKTPAIQVRWVAQPVKGDAIRGLSVKEINPQRNTTSIGGFKMNQKVACLCPYHICFFLTFLYSFGNKFLDLTKTTPHTF